MGSEVASLDGERKPDSRPAPQTEKQDGTTAAPAAPSGGLAGGRGGRLGGGLGGMAVRAKAVVGAADAPAERAADATADRVMRRLDQRSPSTSPAAGLIPDSTTPIGVPGPVQERVSRQTMPPPEPEPAPEPESPAGEPVVTDQVQQHLDDTRGRGSMLPDALRTEMENAFRRPFDDVRIHDDSTADQAARDLNALAFTIGSDIYFRAGAYAPSTPSGKRLLVHELAHVAQQRPSLGRAVVRRSSTAVPAGQQGPIWKAPAGVDPQGEIDVGDKTLHLAKVVFPDWKAKVVGKNFGRRRGKRPETQQRSIWDKEHLGHVEQEVGRHLAELTGRPANAPDLVAKSGTNKQWDYYIGSAGKIAERVVRPLWTKGERRYRRFDVDHRRDVQLFADEEPASAYDNINNLWLFESELNRKAGRTMSMAMDEQIEKFMKNARPYLKPAPYASTVQKSFKVTFAEAVSSGEDVASEDHSWTSAELRSPALVAGLKALTAAEHKKIAGTPNTLMLFSSSYGGRHQKAEIDDKGNVAAGEWERRPRKDVTFTATHIDFKDPGAGGTAAKVGGITGRAKSNAGQFDPMTFTVDLMGLPGLRYAASVTNLALRDKIPRYKPLSPINFADLAFDVHDGLVGRGVILPESSLLKGLEVAMVLEGGNLAVEALLAGGDLNLPGPFKVMGGHLALSAGTQGIVVAGRVDFEIEKLATGFIAAGSSSKAGEPSFALEGELNFDTKMFTKARLGLSYRDSRWGVRGELEVGPNKISGIRRAAAKVSVDDETVSAAGEFETSLKGVERGALGFAYDPATGMAITGEILIGKGIPGIKGGRLNATVAQTPAGDWSLAGAVTAEPDIPGLTGTIGGTYADGAFLAEADLAYERGLAKGRLKAGLTNRTLDEAGLPAGPADKDGALVAYGEGVVTLAVTPWLQGTVGLRLSPKGEIEVTGKVAMPPRFTVFEERAVEREILAIGIDLPIVGVAVAGQRIGVFATIKGGVTVSAGFGPGQLRDVALEVTYSPDRPDDTTVKGTGTFAVPAQAGLRVQVNGGLGVGIPVVSATAGVSIHGEVGVAGEASAAAALNWTPRTGIVLDARGEIFVEPKFKFGVDAFVDVSADLWLTEIELYHRTWKLAAFEYGSNLRFGLAFPLHYASDQPFALSFDQIQWTYPQLNPPDLLGGLMKQLVG
ncbi:DUF4157 domain-containing protein [Nonomuraea sp. PA05]|uniref:eCIS core domain-containing protein n=1 Tax=Nonomuraea sp. PA05 TaxID=2604466 RepID=UPI0011D4BE2A|nr:DUF4157 domain-containing protein [Nonomuraea sp. PA05]TYB64808.1 DUF4157 domain-containing protein [Nonomuraea sp. PA05]